MQGQMTALLIGGDSFRDLMRERGVAPLGLAPAIARDADDAAHLAAAMGADIHVVLLELNDDEAPSESVRRALRLPFPLSVPLISVGSSDDAVAASAIRAGAFHHLAPTSGGALIEAAVGAAIRACQQLRRMDSDLKARSRAMALLTEAKFRFRTPEEASDLAVALADTAPNPQRLTLGLLELMLNAIEHGNLNIGSSEKSRLRAGNQFAEEVERRLSLPEYRDRWATLHLARDADALTLTISDSGAGFDWRARSMEAEAAPTLNGRGIMLARSFGFDQVEFEGAGNRVVAITRRA